LAEAVQSFLNQDYPGPKEMVILNTLRHQQIVCDAPNVRVFNIPRPPSLGDCRNAAIELCQNEIIVLLDDDDIILPWHLSNYAGQFSSDVQWAHLSGQFYAEGEQIKSVVPGTCNVLAYRKAAWQTVGRFPSMNCGEDRAFAKKVEPLPGVHVMVYPELTSYIYRWGVGVYKISGQGDDQPGCPTGHDRMERYTVEGILSGRIPTGKIKIVPKMKLDWTAMAKEFLSTPAKPKSL
jgi:hypothetical protein